YWEVPHEKEKRAFYFTRNGKRLEKSLTIFMSKTQDLGFKNPQNSNRLSSGALYEKDSCRRR
ncbi:MAG: hypothetical protein ACQEWA_07660, partial [Sphaerochaetaceae bacterium]